MSVKIECDSGLTVEMWLPDNGQLQLFESAELATQTLSAMQRPELHRTISGKLTSNTVTTTAQNSLR